MNVKAKICGLSTPETVAAAVSNGASFIGFNFYDKSPRHVTPKQMAKLSEGVPSGVNRVAVCVDADDQTLSEIVKIGDPDYLQLHGSETSDRVRQIRDRFARRLIKAIRVADPSDLEHARQFEAAVDILLFDAKPSPKDKAALPGGNAQTFDWSLLAGQAWDGAWMLSGGLTKDNVGTAVKVTGAPMVDVSSGVEAKRGIKDPKLIEEFLETVGRL